MWPDRVGVLHGPVPGKPASADPLGRRQNPGVERGAGGLGRKGRGGRSCSSPQASGEALDPPHLLSPQLGSGHQDGRP